MSHVKVRHLRCTLAPVPQWLLHVLWDLKNPGTFFSETSGSSTKRILSEDDCRFHPSGDEHAEVGRAFSKVIYCSVIQQLPLELPISYSIIAVPQYLWQICYRTPANTKIHGWSSALYIIRGHRTMHISTLYICRFSIAGQKYCFTFTAG